MNKDETIYALIDMMEQNKKSVAKLEPKTLRDVAKILGVSFQYVHQKAKKREQEEKANKEAR